MDDLKPTCRMTACIPGSAPGPKVHIIRPYRLHAMHRCGLLLQMSHVAWSMSLCIMHTGELYKKTVELMEMPFAG